MKMSLQLCNQAPRCHKTLLKNHGKTSFTSLEDDFTADTVHLEETNVSQMLVMADATYFGWFFIISCFHPSFQVYLSDLTNYDAGNEALHFLHCCGRSHAGIGIGTSRRGSHLQLRKILP